MIKTATISRCGKFRYTLGRRWAEGQRLLAYVMFNPSTADAEDDDATIRRCIRFAQAHGFDALEVVNLFAYRARDPKDLRNAGYLVGPENDAHIQHIASIAEEVCVAWGALAADLARPQVVLPQLRMVGTPISCLRITRSGHPQHPLMLASSCKLQPFTPEAIQDAMQRGGRA